MRVHFLFLLGLCATASAQVRVAPLPAFRAPALPPFGAAQALPQSLGAAAPLPALAPLAPLAGAPDSLKAVPEAADAGAARENIFDKDPAQDPENVRANYLKKRGLHFYFRNALLKMQDRFAQLVPHEAIPVVFLHGSPHVDNLSKSARGAAMVDFDRSRMGPYAWDLVRMVTSLSIRQKDPGSHVIPRKAAKKLLKGYLQGFRNPEKGFEQMPELKDQAPGPGERTTSEYLKAGGKWAQEMRASPLPPEHADVQGLLKGYLSSRGELGLLKDWHVEEAGRGAGSMGRARILLVLAPNDPHSRKDRMLFEIKRVREDADSKWYTDPFDHQGKRMIAASELYAPGWDSMQGFTTYEGEQYWGHKLPTQNLKLKKDLSRAELKHFAYAVGTQLGRAHRLSLQSGSPAALEAHLLANYGRILRAAQTMKAELTAAHRRYLKKLKAGGLDPE